MDASEFSSSQYSNLLGTVSDLRNDLEKAVSELQSLRESNETLKRENEALHEAVLETRKKYVEAQENYMNTVAAKLETEKQYEVLCVMINFWFFTSCNVTPFPINRTEFPRQEGTRTRRKN